MVGETISYYKILSKLPEYIGTSGDGGMSSLIQKYNNLIDLQIRLMRILDPKLYGTDVPTFNSPLHGDLKATRFAGGRLVLQKNGGQTAEGGGIVHDWEKYFTLPNH